MSAMFNKLFLLLVSPRRRRFVGTYYSHVTFIATNIQTGVRVRLSNATKKK